MKGNLLGTLGGVFSTKTNNKEKKEHYRGDWVNVKEKLKYLSVTFESSWACLIEGRNTQWKSDSNGGELYNT